MKKQNQDRTVRPGPPRSEIPSVAVGGAAVCPKGPAIAVQALCKPYETPDATRGNT